MTTATPASPMQFTHWRAIWDEILLPRAAAKVAALAEQKSAAPGGQFPEAAKVEVRRGGAAPSR
jgi:hypothetical protein